MPSAQSSSALPAILIAPHTIWAHYIGTLWECTICCSSCAGIASHWLSALCCIYRCPVPRAILGCKGHYIICTERCLCLGCVTIL